MDWEKCTNQMAHSFWVISIMEKLLATGCTFYKMDRILKESWLTMWLIA